MPTIHRRHTCKICKQKRIRPLILSVQILDTNSIWICRNCVSSIADTSTLRHTDQKPQFVELFSGSGHISKIAATCGFNTTTIDIESKYNPDICLNIENLRRSQLPRFVDVVWASIPCQVYSILNLENHWNKISIGYRQYYYIPITTKAIQALRILHKTIKIIKQMKPLYYFIENPRGALRHFPQLQFVPFRHTVSYADYGFDYYKPTDLFTNCKNFNPTPIKTAVGQHFKSGVLDLHTAHERSFVPPKLILEVLSSVKLSGIKIPKKFELDLPK